MLKSKALKAISLLWLSSLLGAGCAFFTQVIMARELGLEQFGLFSSALSLAALLTPIAGFGIPQLWLKIFGEEGRNGVRWLNPSFLFIVQTTFFAIGMIFIWAWLGPHSVQMRTVLITLTLYTIGQVFIEVSSSKLQLEERYMLLGVIQLTPHALRLIAFSVLHFFAALTLTANTAAVIYAVVASPIIIWGVSEMGKMRKGRFSLKGHENRCEFSSKEAPTLKNVAANAWPFGLAGAFHIIISQANIVLIGYMIGPSSAGIFNVAFTVMTAVYLLPTVIYQKFLLPKFHIWANFERDKFYKVYKSGNRFMLMLGVLAMAAIMILSPWAIPFLFGSEYSDVISVLSILAVCAPIRFLANSVGAVLITQQHMKKKVYFMGVTAFLNIVFIVSLTKLWGQSGAAIATILSDSVLLAFYYFSARCWVFKEHRQTN